MVLDNFIVAQNDILSKKILGFSVASEKSVALIGLLIEIAISFFIKISISQEKIIGKFYFFLLRKNQSRMPIVQKGMTPRTGTISKMKQKKIMPIEINSERPSKVRSKKNIKSRRKCEKRKKMEVEDGGRRWRRRRNVPEEEEEEMKKVV